MNGKLRVLVAEDHLSVRDGLIMIVNAEPDMEVVGEAGDGRAAISLAKELKPDVVVMDISMPTLNGLKAAATLKRQMPEVKIVTLTRHTDEAYMKELFQAGVSGYVLKQSSSNELIRAIRAVIAGETFIDPSMLGLVFESYGKKGRPDGGPAVTTLTLKEEELLSLVAHGYSNREIAERMDISPKTVEAHKAMALKKLKITTRREIVQYAFLRGWMTQNYDDQ